MQVRDKVSRDTLIRQAERMVQESGSPRGSTRPLGWILGSTNPTGARWPAPRDFMDTDDGRTLVSQLLGRQQSSAYT